MRFCRLVVLAVVAVATVGPASAVRAPAGAAYTPQINSAVGQAARPTLKITHKRTVGSTVLIDGYATDPDTRRPVRSTLVSHVWT